MFHVQYHQFLNMIVACCCEPKAVKILQKKNTQEVICTRSALLGESTESTKGGGKQSLVIGGLALSKGKGKGTGKGLKPESESADAEETAWSWLYKSAPHKCTMHLLR